MRPQIATLSQNSAGGFTQAKIRAGIFASFLKLSPRNDTFTVPNRKVLMTENQPNAPNDPLRSALAEWKIATPLPPRFDEQVWRRIESMESRPAAWVVIASWLEALFKRPAAAAGYMAVLTALGLGLGFTEAQKKVTELNAQLSSRYVQSIDPYQRAR